MNPTNTDFIKAAFHNLASDEVVWVTGFPGDPHTVQKSYWFGRGVPPLPYWMENTAANNYVAISSFKRGNDQRFRRRKDLFGAMHLIMVDDVGTKVDHDRLQLAPSAMVETSPGNHQAWYFLSEPETQAHRAEALINGLIAGGLTADGTDPGMKGVTRYGRLPCGVNAKAKYVEVLGDPFQQRTVIWQPDRKYTLNEIADAFGVDLTATTEQRRRRTPVPKPPGADERSDEVVDLLVRAGHYLEQHSSIAGAHQIICPWVYEHTDEDPTGTVYFAPSEENGWRGGFKCHHGHCQERTHANFAHFLSRLQQLEQKGA